MNKEMLKSFPRKGIQIAPGVTVCANFSDDDKLLSIDVFHNNRLLDKAIYSEKSNALLVRPSLKLCLNKFDPKLSNFRRLVEGFGIVPISLFTEFKTLEQYEKEVVVIIDQGGFKAAVQDDEVWGTNNFQNQSPGSMQQFHNTMTNTFGFQNPWLQPVPPQFPAGAFPSTNSFDPWGHPAVLNQNNSSDPVIRSNQIGMAIKTLETIVQSEQTKIDGLKAQIENLSKEKELIESSPEFSLVKSLRSVEAILASGGLVSQELLDVIEKLTVVIQAK